MLTPILNLAAIGAAGVILWKLLGILLLPLLGVALGFILTIIKFAMILSLLLFALWLFRRSSRREAGAS